MNPGSNQQMKQYDRQNFTKAVIKQDRLDQKLIVKNNKDLDQCIGKQKTGNKMKVNKQQPQCIACQRIFSNYKIKSYEHAQCGHEYCYPCLYRLYNSQIQMFQSNKTQQKQKYQLYICCCEYKGSFLKSYYQNFKYDLCVFCGISVNLRTQRIVRIQNKICFCLECLFIESRRQKYPDSIRQLVLYIEKNVPTDCVFCERKIQFKQHMENNAIKAMNLRLCLTCFGQLSNKQKLIQNVLFEFKAKSVSYLQNKDKLECCQCHQQLISNQSQENAQFQLFKWRNNKIYCNICLYFRYYRLRENYLNTVKNKKTSDKQLSLINHEKCCYQYHFAQRCMICAKEQSNKDHLHILQKQVDENQEQLDYQLSCMYCSQCLRTLSKQPVKYKRLMDMKEEMIRRDKRFVVILEQQNQRIMEQVYQSDLKKGFKEIKINIEKLAYNASFSVNFNFIKNFCGSIQDINQPQRQKRDQKGIKRIYFKPQQETPQQNSQNIRNLTQFPQFCDHNQNQTASQQQTAHYKSIIQDQQFYDVLKHNDDGNQLQQNKLGCLNQSGSIQELQQLIPQNQLTSTQQNLFLIEYPTLQQQYKRKHLNESFQRDNIKRREQIQRKIVGQVVEDRKVMEMITQLQGETFLKYQEQADTHKKREEKKDYFNKTSMQRVITETDSAPVYIKKCKILSCNSYSKHHDNNKLSKSKRSANNQGSNNITKQDNQQQKGQQLMMDLLCKQCFVYYLLGLMDLTKEIQAPKLKQWKLSRQSQQEDSISCQDMLVNSQIRSK